MKKIIRKLITGIVSLSIVVSSATVGQASEPFIIFERANSSKLSGGITHDNIQKFTSVGWWNINVIRVDLRDGYTDIDTIFSKEGVSNKETVSELVKSSNAIAAINGDFFWKTNNNYPLGAMMSNGQIISTPDYVPNEKAVFSITNNKIPFISYWQASINIKTASGESIKVLSKNKDNALYGDVCMYDSNWSKKTLGNSIFPDMAEIIVTNGIVTGIRVGQEPTDMPKDGYILVGRNQAKDILLNNFRVGDRVTVEEFSIPDFEEIKSAVGGGAILVKDGQVQAFSHNITGEHPRTAIGINKDRTEVIMVTVDGRHSSFKGVSQDRLARIMIELGAYEALNLDGGGSTTMVISPQNTEKPIVVNYPSDGGQRKVVNGIGAFSNAPEMPLEYIEIEVEDTNIFVDTTRKFNIKGFDKHHNPVDVDLDRVEFTIDGLDGRFKNNILTAKEVGTGIVKAEYEGITSTIKINVLDELADIVIDPDSIFIDTNSVMPLDNIYGKNNYGYTAKIEFEDIRWDVLGNIGKMEDGAFFSGKVPGSGAIIASLGNAIENITVAVGYDRSSIESFENIESIQLSTYPSEKVLANISKSEDSIEGMYSIELTYDFTQVDENRAAYIKMDPNNNKLEQNFSQLGMWVNGNESGHWLRGTLKDNRGVAHKIDFAYEIDWSGWKWVTGKIPNNISYPVVLEEIYIVQTDPLKKDKGKLLIDGIQGLTPVKYKEIDLPNETVVKDPLQRHSEVKENGYSFVVTNGVYELNNLLKLHIGEKIKNTINNNQIGITIGDLNDEILNQINKPILKVTSGYSTNRYKDILFIQLDDTKNGIRATNPNQWLNFEREIQSSGEKNIVILLPKPIFGENGFTDKLEAELFKERLIEYSNNGKNIFVIYGGNKTKTDLESGIRFIEFNGNLGENINIFDLNQLVFTVNGDEITYEIKPLF